MELQNQKQTVRGNARSLETYSLPCAVSTRDGGMRLFPPSGQVGSPSRRCGGPEASFSWAPSVRVFLNHHPQSVTMSPSGPGSLSCDAQNRNLPLIPNTASGRRTGMHVSHHSFVDECHKARLRASHVFLALSLHWNLDHHQVTLG